MGDLRSTEVRVLSRCVWDVLQGRVESDWDNKLSVSNLSEVVNACSDTGIRCF